MASHGTVTLQMKEDNNYVRWRAGSQKKVSSGLVAHSTGTRSLPLTTSKEKVCQEIVQKLHAKGLHHRSSREVRSKINDLERSYRAARDWTNSTGEGIRDEDKELGETHVRTKILKICKHYDVLHPIMGDRPAARPIFTNEEEENNEVSWLEKDPNDDADEEEKCLESLPVETNNSSNSYPTNSTSSKRGFGMLDIWREMTQATTLIDKERAGIEKAKLQIESKRLRLDEEKSKWEAESRRIQALKEKALAKLELKKAGMTDEEIAAIFDN
ncbi:hypothetical protein LEN26_003459 [Aphanomyces euteiches]|nr:hypothetical protein AeMF1_005993 [Aphanomyces euteiches]KAH9154043.1 hypothetical protein LEN26_003459 [Aphanomyces euteiches]KAH9183139.1 hypothetical protein AeNC1_014883 [Aphanomyces euteiches]